MSTGRRKRGAVSNASSLPKLREAGHQGRAKENGREEQTNSKRGDADQPQHQRVSPPFKKWQVWTVGFSKGWPVEPEGFASDEMRFQRTEEADHQEEDGPSYTEPNRIPAIPDDDWIAH